MTARILHVITSFTTGGAERMLLNLLSRTDRERFEPAVLSLMQPGDYARQVEAMGFPVHSLGLIRGTLTARALVDLLRIARELRPHLVSGWMYHANVAATVAARTVCAGARLVWGIHNSLHSLAYEKPSTALLIRAGVPLSRLADAIVYVSRASLSQHAAFGYSGGGQHCIPNGYDTQTLRPAPLARARIRRSLGIDEEAVVIGHLARYDPIKDHRTFTRAAALLLEERPEIRFVLAGPGVEAGNPELARFLSETPAGASFHLLGERTDVPAVLASLDILCSSSRSEAFPNVLGEAMSCGVPCVVTDVGDSAWIVGGTGAAVPPGDPPALAAALGRMVSLGAAGRARLGDAARQRVEREFSLPSVVARYEDLYSAVLGL